MRDAGAGEAETQIRALLNFRECRVSSALPGDLAYLQTRTRRRTSQNAMDSGA
jgi:hypothetical protein